MLAALATAISVPARLAAEADLPTPEESLAAIGSAKAAYATGGAARLVSGLALAAAAGPLARALPALGPPVMPLWALNAARFLLAASGTATAVSGGCAIALAFLAAEPQATAILTSGSPAGGVQGALLEVRWATGALGFTLAGLSLVALAPVQWQMGGILRVTAVIDAVLGVAMLFIWIDAATFVHRITGIAFLLWLILAGLWLVIPRLRAIGTPPAASSPSRRGA